MTNLSSSLAVNVSAPLNGGNCRATCMCSHNTSDQNPSKPQTGFHFSFIHTWISKVHSTIDIYIYIYIDGQKYSSPSKITFKTPFTAPHHPSETPWAPVGTAPFVPTAPAICVHRSRCPAFVARSTSRRTDGRAVKKGGASQMIGIVGGE